MSLDEEPADAVLAALDEWQMRSWKELNEAVEENEAEPEWSRIDGSIAERWRDVVSSARLLLSSMNGQALHADLRDLLNAISDTPIEAAGLDGRRLGLTRFGGTLLRQHLDAEMLRQLAIQFSGGGDMARYELLFVSALHTPAQLMPIAHEYLARAARLLILGLDVECIVFCRAALEAALKQRISDEEMVMRGKMKRVVKGREYDYDLGTRISAARVAPALFDKALGDRAFDLKEDGNRAVHPDAQQTYEAPLNAVYAFTTLTLAVRKLLANGS
jgi:hypothetical protein